MKHITSTLFLFLLFPLLSVGQTFTVTASDRGHLSLHFELGGFSIDTVRHEGELMHTIATKDIVMPNDYGQPNLPIFSHFVAIPQGAKAIVEVNMRRGEYMTGINLEPSVGSQCENDDARPFFKDPKVYTTNSFFPSESYYAAAPQQLRGVDVIHLSLCPFQFNPVTHELAIHRDMDIDIRFEGGNGHFGDDRLRSPYWDPILCNNILNYESLEPIDYNARRQQWSKTRTTGCEYLILTPDNDAYYSAAQELSNHRNKQGILTKVMRVTETDAVDSFTLRLWFRDIYAHWDIPPAAVCIIGESGDDLHNYVPGYRTLHPKDNFITSDNPYADVNDDFLPDICFSRLIAQNESELPLFIGKQLEYEYTNPVTDLHYYTHPLTAAGWQNDKWFQITIATISGFLSQHGKTPTRVNEIYAGTQGPNWSTAPGTYDVVNYFGPNGLGYIPATPNELGGWTGGTAQDVIQSINSGAYLVQHRDHGWNTKWYQPEIYTTDFDAINNPGKMTYLISVNCRTGMYDISTVCFVEALIRMTRDGQNAGIVGAIAPTGQTYSFANDIFLWGVWDLLESSFLPNYGPFASHPDTWMPAFACVSGKYFLESQVFPGADQNMCTTTYNTFHTHGDTFLRIFTDVPQPIESTHDEIIQCFTPFHITAPEGSQIALTVQQGRNWNILATATGTGEEQEITLLEYIPVGPIHLTITGQNLLRLEEDIPLMPFDGPFVVVDSIAMNDTNLVLHYNQTATADIHVTNVGLSECDSGSVIFSSNSEHLTILQGEVPFAPLSSNESQFIEDAFQISLSDDIHDRTSIPFTLTTRFGDETYSQDYEIDILAPNIKVELIDIDDAQGDNDGRLDPGEHASLTFRVTNNGHYRADSPRLSLRNDEGLIRVITSETSIDDLEIDSTAEVTFDIYVEYAAGAVTSVHFIFQTLINSLRFEQEIQVPIGFVLEDFELNQFDPTYWTNDPLHPWEIVASIMSFEGDHCAKSCPINDNESSQLTLTFTSSEEGNISFYSRVSCEPGWDKLYFYIDEEEQGSWTGELWWAEQTFATTPGRHYYKWIYAKDSSTSIGSDCAWIDYITLPHHLDATSERTDLPLTIHPNPTTDQVVIELEQKGNFSLSVYDSNGSLIHTERNATVVSFKDRPAGIYHIIVEQNGQHLSRKIIKM